mmetsp:Transcript_28995/g.93386  ORF Transcript_28995/g.93386 Transcript_28995/m.93386 type:complete len:335 (-) Transcript_28995:543-1547(-)
MRQVPQPPQGMDRVRAGEQGAPADLPEEGEGAEQGEADRRFLHLDGSALEASQAQADGAEGGLQRGDPAASLRGRGRDPQLPVHQLPHGGSTEHLESSSAGETEGGPQEDLLPAGAAHPQVQGPPADGVGEGGAGRHRLLLPPPPPCAEVPRLCQHRRALQDEEREREADLRGLQQQQDQRQVHLLRRDPARVQGRHNLPAPQAARHIRERGTARALHRSHPVSQVVGPPDNEEGGAETGDLLPPSSRCPHVNKASNRVHHHRRRAHRPRQRQDAAGRAHSRSNSRSWKQRSDLSLPDASWECSASGRHRAGVRPDCRCLQRGRDQGVAKAAAA